MEPHYIIDVSIAYPSVVIDTNMNLINSETLFAIKNDKDKLLLYSEGNEIYNGDHETIEMGNFIGSTWSSYQGMQWTFNDQYPNTFNLFTSDRDLYHLTIENQRVVSIEKLFENTTEHIVGCANPCGGVWIIVFDKVKMEYVSFLFDNDKLIKTVASKVGKAVNEFTHLGNLRLNPQNNLLALNSYLSLMEFYTFNTQTGVISNPVTYNPTQKITYPIRPLSFFSGDFCADGTKYYSFRNSEDGDTLTLIQLDLTNLKQNIIIETPIGHFINNTDDDYYLGGKINRANNGKIYVFVRDSMASIENPNLPGVACNFVKKNFPPPFQNNIAHGDNTYNKLIQYHDVIPEIRLPEDTSICQQDVLAIDLSQYNGKIQWQDGDTAKNYTIDTEGIFHINYISPEGCVQADTISIINIISDTIIMDTTICSEESLIIGSTPVYSSGIYWDTLNFTEQCPEYRKYFVNIDSSATIIDTIQVEILEGESYLWNGVEYKQNGLYFSAFENENGCLEEKYLNLKVKSIERFYAPNIFSPNNDGINDEFKLESIFESSLTIQEFLIFDRYGNIVYLQNGHLSPSEISWDGTNNNNILIEGVYTYLVKYNLNTESEIFTGTITLIK